VLVLIAASKQTFKLAESRNAMNTIRRYAADDAHVIFGTAYDEGLGDQLRVTVIATGLSKVGSQRQQPPQGGGVRVTQPLSVVGAPGGGNGPGGPREFHVAQGARTGTDNLPILNQIAQPGAQQGPGSGATAMAPSYEGMNTPSVWRSARSQAAAKVDALASSGVDEIEIPAFLRKQAD
jgi:cell division protein FtsZ